MLLTSFFWYIYPIAITETIKHTRSQKRQQELFLRVQKHILIAISIIYTLTSLVIWLIPAHKTQAISVNEAISIAKEYNAKNIPLLVSITTDWSYTKLTNKSKLYQLEQKGMHVITFNHVGDSQTINDWLQTYNYPTTPLNILFTKRHPKGLVLPTDLNQINWENATATFN